MRPFCAATIDDPRLQRIEGQARGIAHTINEGRTANEVLIQFRAIDND